MRKRRGNFVLTAGTDWISWNKVYPRWLWPWCCPGQVINREADEGQRQGEEEGDLTCIFLQGNEWNTCGVVPPCTPAHHTCKQHLHTSDLFCWPNWKVSHWNAYKFRVSAALIVEIPYSICPYLNIDFFGHFFFCFLTLIPIQVAIWLLVARPTTSTGGAQ